MLFSQTCGYPLETVFRGQAVRLGAPVYDVPGCDGPTHRAFFIVPESSPARSVADLRGGVFLLNSPVSNSGMNLPRRALAEIAGGQPFFREIVVTGSHPASLDRLLRGEGDAASIDCVTYAFWRHYRPEAAARVRIVGETPVSPSIPFVTSVATPPKLVEILHSALRRLAREPAPCRRSRRAAHRRHRRGAGQRLSRSARLRAGSRRARLSGTGLRRFHGRRVRRPPPPRLTVRRAIGRGGYRSSRQGRARRKLLQVEVGFQGAQHFVVEHPRSVQSQDLRASRRDGGKHHFVMLRAVVG
jgi:hypothetical protein